MVQSLEFQITSVSGSLVYMEWASSCQILGMHPRSLLMLCHVAPQVSCLPHHPGPEQSMKQKTARFH